MIPLKILPTYDDAQRFKHSENVRDTRHGNPKRQLVIRHVVGALKDSTSFLVAQLEAGEHENLD
jgi:hypothetical protein